MARPKINNTPSLQFENEPIYSTYVLKSYLVIYSTHDHNLGPNRLRPNCSYTIINVYFKFSKNISLRRNLSLFIYGWALTFSWLDKF